MEQKTIQEVIQIFCPICSKGILVRNESMYKCKKCSKEVCLVCFDRPARLCVECSTETKSESEHSRRKSHNEELTITTTPVKQSRKLGLLLVAAGLVIISAAFLLGAIVNLPTIVVGVLELMGFALFLKGFLIIKD